MKYQEDELPEETQSIGRNDPCHCGSGKKYKQCCLAKDEAKEREARSKATAKEESEVAAAEAPPPPRAPKHTTQQPWKGPKNTRGFQRLNIPRRSGGS